MFNPGPCFSATSEGSDIEKITILDRHFHSKIEILKTSILHLEIDFFNRGLLTNPGNTPITILAVNSDHGLSFAGEETRTMV